jgi:hypothetical protein
MLSYAGFILFKVYLPISLVYENVHIFYLLSALHAAHVSSFVNCILITHFKLKSNSIMLGVSREHSCADWGIHRKSIIATL